MLKKLEQVNCFLMLIPIGLINALSDEENNFILFIALAMNHGHFRLTLSVQYPEDQDSKLLLPSKTLVLQLL